MIRYVKQDTIVALEPFINLKSQNTPGTTIKILAFVLFSVQMYACFTTLQSVFFYLSYEVMKRGDTKDK